MIPYGRHDIDQADIDAVLNVLRSDRLTQGPLVPRFEAAVAADCGAGHAVAVNSATSALHIACLALALGPGDRLWTVPNTFVASANCGRYCGASVDFVDIDPATWNISVPALREKLATAKRSGELPKVLVPVDFGGQPVDQEAIAALAREFGFRVIEDASHAIGASRHGVPVGAGKHADITIFSFHPVKIITSGEGGIALTNDADLASRMNLFRSHGVTKDSSLFTEKAAGPWHYEQLELGYNYRLTDIHAALGLSQHTKLASNVDERNRLADRYKTLMTNLPLRWQHIESGNRSAYHLFSIRIDRQRVARSHADVFQHLVDSGIGVNLHYQPVHLQPYYRRLGFRPGQFPESEAYASEAITVPLFAAMTDAEQDMTVDAVAKALK